MNGPKASLTRRDTLSLTGAVGAGFAVSALLQNLPLQARKVTLTPAMEAVLNDPGSPTIGSATPKVTIVLFTDYQCPICKATDPALTRLLDRDPTVRVVFKDWPIFGALSLAAARAALAGWRQGKYLPFHHGLMAARVRLDESQLRRIATSAGIDWLQLADAETRMGNQLETQLRRHALQAWSLGLSGTPAYLVGPYLYEGGLGDHHLAQAVRRARISGPIV